MNWFEKLFCNYDNKIAEVKQRYGKLIIEQAVLNNKLMEDLKKSNELLLSKDKNYPNLRTYKDYGKSVNPRPYFANGTFIADPEYQVYPMAVWMTMLSAVRKSFTATWTKEIFDCPVPEDVGWGLGLFLADGSCGFSKSNTNKSGWWRITNTNREFLEKAKRAFEREWTDYKFDIVEYPSEAKGKKTNLGIRKEGLKHLEVRPKIRKGNYGKRKEFIEKFRNSFYFEDIKKIPRAFWDKNRLAKRALLYGTIAGDGNKKQKLLTASGSQEVIGLCKCMDDMNWRYKIYPDKRHKSVYTIAYNNRYEYEPLMADFIRSKTIVTFEILRRRFPELKQSKIEWVINRLCKQGYVKKQLKKPSSGRPQVIETVKEYPEACDNFASLMASKLQFAAYKSGFTQQPAFGYAVSRTHAYNCFICDGMVHIYEPQTNRVIGELGKTPAPYDTIKVWFFG